MISYQYNPTQQSLADHHLAQIYELLTGHDLTAQVRFQPQADSVAKVIAGDDPRLVVVSDNGEKVETVHLNHPLVTNSPLATWLGYWEQVSVSWQLADLAHPGSRLVLLARLFWFNRQHVEQPVAVQLKLDMDGDYLVQVEQAGRVWLKWHADNAIEVAAYEYQPSQAALFNDILEMVTSAAQRADHSRRSHRVYYQSVVKLVDRKG